MSGWVQILKAFECQANEFVLYHAGNGETLKTLHSWGGTMKRGSARKCIWRRGEMEGGRPEGRPHTLSIARQITMAVTAGAGTRRQRQVRSSRGELPQVMTGDEESDRKKGSKKIPEVSSLKIQGYQILNSVVFLFSSLSEVFNFL